MLTRLFQPSPAKLWAERAFATVTAQSRLPGLYGPGRTPDTVDGRFEMLTLHAAPAFLRLKGDPAVERLADAFADRFFLGLDDGLREEGVGVLSVPRVMKKLASRVYGRLSAYEAALGNEAALAKAVARNVFNAEEATFAGALARRLTACVVALRSSPAEALAEAATWPALDASFA